MHGNLIAQVTNLWSGINIVITNIIPQLWQDSLYFRSRCLQRLPLFGLQKKKCSQPESTNHLQNRIQRNVFAMMRYYNATDANSCLVTSGQSQDRRVRKPWFYHLPVTLHVVYSQRITHNYAYILYASWNHSDCCIILSVINYFSTL